MRLECPHCQAGYEFPVELIADEAFAARCSACGGPFRIGREGVLAPRVAPTRPLPMPLPAQPSAVAPAPPPPVAEPEAPEDELDADPEATPEPAHEGAGFYMVLRGGTPKAPGRLRRVAVIPRTSGKAPPPARVVSVNATFGRGPRAARTRPAPPPPETPGEVTAELTERLAAPAPPPPTTQRRAAVFAALTLLSTSAAAAAFWLSADPPEPLPPPPMLAVATDAPSVPAPATQPRLMAEVLTVEAFPDKNAAFVRAHVFNGSPEVHTAIRLDIVLQVDNIVERRREVWCCEALELDAALVAANDPVRRRAARRPDPARIMTLEPGADEDLTVVFSGLDAATLQKPLGAAMRIMEATRQPAR